MTVVSTSIRASFEGSGSTGPFTFAMTFDANSEITVEKIDADGVATVLSETTHYTLTGAGTTSGGSLTLVTALAEGEELAVERVVPLTQLTSYRNQGAFFPEIHERSYDRATKQIQQVYASAARAIKLPRGDIPVDLASADDRANTLLGFDASGVLELKTASYTVVVESGGGGEATLVLSDASVGPTTVELPSSGEVIIIKIDDTENAVTVTPGDGATVCRESTIDLTIQDEPIHLKFYGTNWYRI